MDCKRANIYITKYMDGCMGKKEANKLHEHISGCAKCKELFMVYSELIDAFEQIEDIKAPIGFEWEVMEKIKTIEPEYQQSFRFNMEYMILCVFSVLAGVGAWLVVNKNALEQYLINTKGLEAYVSYFNSIEIYAKRIDYGVTNVLNSLYEAIAIYLPIGQVGIVVFVVAFVGLSLVKKRSRVEL